MELNFPKVIIKRDGSVEPFKPYKIEDAIKAAFDSVLVPYDKKVYEAVLIRISFDTVKAVEEIQDIIEYELHRAGYFDVMKSFITYRFLHKMQREHIL